jgi:hypothetical protein
VLTLLKKRLGLSDYNNQGAIYLVKKKDLIIGVQGV